MDERTYVMAVEKTRTDSINMYVRLFGLRTELIEPPVIEEEEHAWHKYAYLSPVVRPGDPALFAEILDAFERKPTLRILEIGAGRTWSPTGGMADELHNCSSAWLGRAVKAAAPKLRYLATDILPILRYNGTEYREYMHFLSLPAKHQLISAPFRLPALTGEPLCSKFSAGRLTAIDLKILDLALEKARQFDSNHRTVNAAFEEHRSKAIKAGAWTESDHYFRPALDREIERQFFGLQVIGGVDCQNLAEDISEVYDLLVARHQGSCRTLRRIAGKNRTRLTACCYLGEDEADALT